jgi:hypothetical protein
MGAEIFRVAEHLAAGDSSSALGAKTTADECKETMKANCWEKIRLEPRIARTVGAKFGDIE